jgi:alpha-glucosidase
MENMNFEIIPGGFRVRLGGITLVEHTAARPWISAGTGRGVFDMYRGNFKVSDELSEKVPLPDFEINKAGGAVRVTFSHGGMFPVTAVFAAGSEIAFERPKWPANRLWLRLKADKNEHVYGCGEQFSCFDLRGRDFPLWTSEQGVGRNKSTYITFVADRDDKAGGDYYSTFFPAPTFVSSRKYFCHVDDSAYMRFDFRKPDRHELEIWDVPRRLVFGTAGSYPGLCSSLTSLLGRQPELPDWVYAGVILGVQGGTEVCLDKLENARRHGVSVAGIWAQDWEGRRVTSFGKRLMWNWQWDAKLYPGLDKTIKELGNQGVRFLGYINPYVAVEGPLYKEASEKGYLAKNREGSDYLVDFGEFYAGVVDFTFAPAAEWYKDVIKKYLIGFGLSGWMADFGEYLPTDIVLHSGEDPEIMHNAWPALWAEINARAVAESGRDDVVFFMRAGFTGSQKYAALLWAGDQNVDWSRDDGLVSVIPAALSAGMSGCGLHHSDIGGYTTLYGMKRTKELFMRWTELAAFTVMMRTHEGNRPEDNWQFDSDDETLAHLKRMTDVHIALAPYLKDAVKCNSLTGVPVQRPIFMHYEDDEAAYKIADEYLLGRDLLVAPVYEQGADARRVHLPRDRWLGLWDGREYSGGDFSFRAPLGFPPVFYRASSPFAGDLEKIKNI